MRRFFTFWWLCTRTAAGGNSTFANDWQWVFGNPAISAFGAAIISIVGALAPNVAAKFGIAEMTTGWPILDTFIGAMGAFVVTWFVAFIVRLFYEPVALFHAQKDRADSLEGIAPAEILSKKRRPIAELRERYLNKSPFERAALDHEADSLQAILDVQVIFTSLNAETEDMTRLMGKAKLEHQNRLTAEVMAIVELARVKLQVLLRSPNVTPVDPALRLRPERLD